MVHGRLTPSADRYNVKVSFLGRSGAHGREEKKAPIAVSLVGIVEVCKSLERAARVAIAPERAEAVGNACRH
jgi:hypothetical protein